jgi:stage IV sporulation protein FB
VRILKIKVDLKIFLIIILYILTKNIKVFAISFIFILLHELGHAITGIILGLKIKKININVFGLSIEFENYGKERLNNKIIIDMAGPAINIITFIIAVIFKNEEIAYINILLAIINLLPIYPLDGGRIVKNLLLKSHNYKQVVGYTEKISKDTLIIITAISSIVILYIKNVGIFLVILYLWSIALKEWKKNQIIKRAFQAIQNNT